MVIEVDFDEKPVLNDPIMIEGLPGIGFVANIAALHMIKELKAKRFASIVSASFQDFAVTTDSGGARTPINELYYHKRTDGGRDIIIWYGNTQALTTYGQYELCGKVLDIVKELGCRFVVSLGGFKKEEIKPIPSIYSAASNLETLKEIADLETKVMVGHIFGIAGLVIGLCRLKSMRGFALLVDTLGMFPDVTATRFAMTSLNKFLKTDIDLSGLEITASETKELLEPFGLIRNITDEKKREEQQMRWFI